MNDNGNLVIGFSTDNLLMLDCDLKTKNEVIEFAKKYSKFHDLGSALVIKTSDSNKIDQFGNRLENFAVVFGKRISREEKIWHINECYILKIINKEFAETRDFPSTSMRANAKNSRKSHPEILYFFENGDDFGVRKYLEFWNICKDLGSAKSVGKKRKKR
jgi:hypothetical protein